MNPWLRLGAGATLLLWLAAVGFCSMDCLGDDCHAATAQLQRAAAGGSSPASGQPDDSLCVSMHSLCLATDASVLPQPNFGPAFALDFLPARQTPAPAPVNAPILRQPPSSNPVFTPEVCLGPAFRSLAPPTFRQA